MSERTVNQERYPELNKLDRIAGKWVSAAGSAKTMGNSKRSARNPLTCRVEKITFDISELIFDTSLQVKFQGKKHADSPGRSGNSCGFKAGG